jgi:hypothetical protein
VTILFADIAGFTAYSSSVPASKGSILSYLFIDNQLRIVVDMLRRLFTEVDKQCIKN